MERKANIFTSDATRRLEESSASVAVSAMDASGLDEYFKASSIANPYAVSKTHGAALIDANDRRQEIIGFGGAITDAVAINYQLLDAQQKQEFLSWHFGPDGANYSFCRIPIQGCDFGKRPFSYARRPWDASLRHFSIDHDRRTVLPVIKDALAFRAEACEEGSAPLHFMATPWSPPWYLKTNLFPCFGGHLRKGSRLRWARMIARYAKDMRAEGVPLSRISIQNEPEARQLWESCLMSAREECELAILVRRELDALGLTDIKLLIWDHNRDRLPERIVESMDVLGAAEVVDGVAFHWYMGEEFENVAATAERWPDLELIASEATQSFCKIEEEPLRHAESYAHDIIGDLNAGAQAWIDWNMLLDDRGGPTYVRNFCAAPARYDRRTQQLHFMKTSAYFAHFSRFIQPGARILRVDLADTLLEVVAAINPGGSVVVVALEWWNIPQTLDVGINLGVHRLTLRCEVSPRSIATIVLAACEE